MKFPENGLFWHWFTITCPAAQAQQWSDLRGHNHPNYPAAQKWWWPPSVWPVMGGGRGATWAPLGTRWCKLGAHPAWMKGGCNNFISKHRGHFSTPKGLLVSLRLPVGPVHSKRRRCRHDFPSPITICSPAQVLASNLFIIWSRPSAPNTDQRTGHHDDWLEMETYWASNSPLSHSVLSKFWNIAN